MTDKLQTAGLQASEPQITGQRPIFFKLFWPIMLAFPLIGLGASWAMTHHVANQGVIWNVPIKGYDPRDLLRGHYIQYRYDWPGMPETSEFYNATALCLKGQAPDIMSVSPLNEFGAARLTKPGAQCDAVVRPNRFARREVQGLSRGIIYIPQAQADAFQKNLNDVKIQTYVRLRIRDDGAMRPLELMFKSKS
jgi:GDYXXLXY protein